MAEEPQSDTERPSESAVSDRRPSDTTRETASPALAQALSITASAFSGPLPPPDVLAAYEHALPGCAERIILMAEEQGTHRRAMERAELEANRKSQTRGQYLAFVLAFVVSAGGIYLLAAGQSVEGLVALLTPLAGLAGIFLINRAREKRKETGALQGRSNSPRLRDGRPARPTPSTPLEEDPDRPNV